MFVVLVLILLLLLLLLVLRVAVVAAAAVLVAVVLLLLGISHVVESVLSCHVAPFVARGWFLMFMVFSTYRHLHTLVRDRKAGLLCPFFSRIIHVSRLQGQLSHSRSCQSKTAFFD